jgi:hypothetical protein
MLISPPQMLNQWGLMHLGVRRSEFDSALPQKPSHGALMEENRSTHVSNPLSDHAQWRHCQETRERTKPIKRDTPLEPIAVRGLIE